MLLFTDIYKITLQYLERFVNTVLLYFQHIFYHYFSRVAQVFKLFQRLGARLAQSLVIA